MRLRPCMAKGQDPSSTQAKVSRFVTLPPAQRLSWWIAFSFTLAANQRLLISRIDLNVLRGKFDKLIGVPNCLVYF